MAIRIIRTVVVTLQKGKGNVEAGGLMRIPGALPKRAGSTTSEWRLL